LVTVDEYNGSKKKAFHLQVKVHLGTCCNTFLKSLIFFFPDMELEFEHELVASAMEIPHLCAFQAC